MQQDLLNLVILSGAFLALFGLAELIYRFGKVKAEYTRKLVHAGTGVLTLLFPLMLHSHWSVLILCSSFLVILLGSWKWDILPSINNIDRFSWGSLLYPVTVYLLFFLSEKSNRNELWFYLPILILAFADPAAALVGKKIPFGKYNVRGSNKTLMGSSAFTLVASSICYALFAFNFDYLSIEAIVMLSLIIGLVSALVEAISSNGVDNLTIPITAFILLDLFLN